MIIHHRLHCLLLLVSHVLGFHCAHLHYSIMAVSWNFVCKPTFNVIMVMAIGSRLKPEICFLPGWLRWILLPKESYGDSLSGCGLNTQPSNWEVDTLPLTYCCPHIVFDLYNPCGYLSSSFMNSSTSCVLLAICTFCISSAIVCMFFVSTTDDLLHNNKRFAPHMSLPISMCRPRPIC